MTAYIQKPWLSSEHDQDPRTATGRPLKWGVVATGGIAHSVTSDLALLADAVLYAVSSRSQASADAFATELGFQRAYGGNAESTGFEQMFADPDVDVVYIATPHAQHFRIAQAAIKAGKHVLVEKAITINAHEAQELITLAQEHKVFLMEAMWSRFLPSIQRAFEIVQSGELGEIKWISADLGFPAPYDPEARLWARRDGGGALLDVSVYPLLWPLGILGFPQAVSAVGTLTDQGVDAQNALTLEYSSGAMAQLTSSLLAYGPRSATVAGSLGSMQTHGSVNNPHELTVTIGRDGTRVEKFSPVGIGYSYELREVTRCIQQGLTESPVMPLEDSLNVMRLFDGARAQLGITYPNDTH
ncbi:Gfo/Idh/MocA family protein [Pseudarthrobacter sp. J1763]|uniref:Gfo/Idh/MocA family protein n=1 Tax=Pseudarthrobacter sp. J1763 TaxID=3420445 RepID=UPI003D27D590